MKKNVQILAVSVELFKGQPLAIDFHDKEECRVSFSDQNTLVNESEDKQKIWPFIKSTSYNYWGKQTS